MKIKELDPDVPKHPFGCVSAGTVFRYGKSLYLKTEGDRGVRLHDGYFIVLSINIPVEIVNGTFVVE